MRRVLLSALVALGLLGTASAGRFSDNLRPFREVCIAIRADAAGATDVFNEVQRMLRLFRVPMPATMMCGADQRGVLLLMVRAEAATSGGSTAYFVQLTGYNDYPQIGNVQMLRAVVWDVDDFGIAQSAALTKAELIYKIKKLLEQFAEDWQKAHR